MERILNFLKINAGKDYLAGYLKLLWPFRVGYLLIRPRNIQNKFQLANKKYWAVFLTYIIKTYTYGTFQLTDDKRHRS